MKLLVVDDEEAFASALRTLFTKLGYEAQISLTPDDAINAIDSFKPDLVTLDIVMPRGKGMTSGGLSVLAKIKVMPHHIPVIIISGSVIAEDEEALKSMGADVVITKPVDIDHLIKTVKHLTS